MNCGNCKHWGVGRRHGVDLGRHHTGKRGCAAISDAYDPQPPLRAQIEVYGYEADGAILFTDADFSCTLWETK